MSNLSNIGFTIENMEEMEELLGFVWKRATATGTSRGDYLYYRDDSGAELWMHAEKNGEYMGFNTYFTGESRHNVCLTEALDSDLSLLSAMTQMKSPN